MRTKKIKSTLTLPEPIIQYMVCAMDKGSLVRTVHLGGWTLQASMSHLG